MHLQLDFFIEDQTILLQREVAKAIKTSDNVRKSVHAKHGAMAKEIRELKERLELLERFICTKDISMMTNWNILKSDRPI